MHFILMHTEYIHTDAFLTMHATCKPIVGDSQNNIRNLKKGLNKGTLTYHRNF